MSSGKTGGGQAAPGLCHGANAEDAGHRLHVPAAREPPLAPYRQTSGRGLRGLDGCERPQIPVLRLPFFRFQVARYLLSQRIVPLGITALRYEQTYSVENADDRPRNVHGQMGERPSHPADEILDGMLDRREQKTPEDPA